MPEIGKIDNHAAVLYDGKLFVMDVHGDWVQLIYGSRAGGALRQKIYEEYLREPDNPEAI